MAAASADSLYRLIFQEIGDTTLALRSEADAVVEVTPALLRATGWTERVLIGRPLGELFCADSATVTDALRPGWLLAPDGRRARAAMRATAAGERGELLLVALESVAWSSPAGEGESRRVGLSRESLERVLSCLPIGNYVTDHDFRVIYWSPVCERIFGFTKSEIIGRRASDVLTRLRLAPDPEIERRAAEAHARLRRGESFRGCGEALCKDGRTISLDWQYAPIHDDSGQRIGYLATLQDATERERALRVLRESEARFRNVADYAPVMIWTTDASGGCTYINQYWRDFTGSGLEDNLGSGWLSYLHPEDRERVGREFEKAVHNRRPLFLEYRLLRADGEYGYCLDTAVPRFGEGREFLGFVGSAIDLTDRHAVEESLRSSEAFLSAILNTVADAIITTDDHGIIKALNPAALRMFGYSADELIGSNVSKLMAEPTQSPERGYLERHMRRRARHAVSTEIEVQARRKDGHVFPARFAVDETWVGPRRLFISILHDLTEWYRLTERLQQAQKMDAVGRLAGGIAHDFNNLLTIINGYGELAIKRLPEAGRVRDMVQAMCDAGQRAAGLTQQLLSFSRKQVISPTVVSLNEVVLDIERMIARLIGEDVIVELKLEPLLGAVRVDKVQVEQALLNLVVNAREAMPHGGTITIRTENVRLSSTSPELISDPAISEGEYVTLSVTDTGSGMDASTLAHLFEPFFTTKAVGHGTGLGLATVYGIVKQAHGHITVASVVGRGSTFTMYLPRSDLSPEHALQDPELVTQASRQEVILLVEDDAGLRSLLADVLSTAGYRVLTAQHGEEGLERSRHHEGDIHLVLTDVVMPRLGGRALVDNLQRERPGIKVLYVSGYTEDAVIRNGIETERVAFLRKPFIPSTLLRRVRELLE